jgi:hypothetical protein
MGITRKWMTVNFKSHGPFNYNNIHWLDINFEIEQWRQLLKEGESERTLFLAVILQALLDATKPTACSVSESNILKSKASSWFFVKSGVTASDFEDVCDLAGIDIEYTRNFAYKVLHSKEKKFIRKRINALLS